MLLLLHFNLVERLISHLLFLVSSDEEEGKKGIVYQENQPAAPWAFVQQNEMKIPYSEIPNFFFFLFSHS